MIGLLKELLFGRAKRPNPWVWQPDFTEMGVRITDVRGKPLNAYVRQVGDAFAIDPLRWYNGHPGEHRTEWKCEPEGCVTWGAQIGGRQHATCNGDGVFWAECTTPAGDVFRTQRCKMHTYVADTSDDPRLA